MINKFHNETTYFSGVGKNRKEIIRGEFYTCDNRKDMVIACHLKDVELCSTEEYVIALEDLIRQIKEDIKESGEEK